MTHRPGVEERYSLAPTHRLPSDNLRRTVACATPRQVTPNQYPQLSPSEPDLLQGCSTILGVAVHSVYGASLRVSHAQHRFRSYSDIVFLLSFELSRLRAGRWIMPWMTPRPCPHCGTLIRGRVRRCPEGMRELWRQQDRGRPSASRRGYGGEWRKRRVAFLATHPTCDDCDQPATEVDHRIPLSQGGLDEPSNYSTKCKECHSRKTATQSGFARPRLPHGG